MNSNEGNSCRLYKLYRERTVNEAYTYSKVSEPSSELTSCFLHAVGKDFDGCQCQSMYVFAVRIDS